MTGNARKKPIMSDIFPDFGGANGATATIAATPPTRRGRWIAAGVLAALAAIGLTAWSSVSQFNQLQHNDVRVDALWTNVVTQYTRRANLIPNLVSVVRSYAAHESALLNQIASTRAGLASLSDDGGNPARQAQFQKAQNELSAQLSRLLMVVEKYPELKSNELFQDLMVQLEGTENRIAFASMQYTEGLADYNYGIRRFPVNLVAAQLGFKPRQGVAQADESALLKPLTVDLK